MISSQLEEAVSEQVWSVMGPDDFGLNLRATGKTVSFAGQPSNDEALRALKKAGAASGTTTGPRSS